MIRTLARSLSLLPAGRDFTCRDTDIMLVSFPRSGNTWLRFLIGNILAEESPTTWENVGSRVPDIYETSKYTLSRMSDPRILKSHECFDRRYRKVIYLVRDPRAVAVSYYHYWLRNNRIAPDYTLQAYVRDFTERNSFTPRYGTWGEHVASWRHVREHDDTFYLLRYEDLLGATETAFGAVLDFLEIEASPHRIGHAIRCATPQRMSDMTHLDRHIVDKNHMMVRKAASRGWKEELADTDEQMIINAWAPLIGELSYIRQ